MKKFIKESLRNKLLEIKDEYFTAYHGRYHFDVKRLYELIESNQIKYEIKEFKPFLLKFFSHPEFSYADPKKLEKLKNQIDYTKPLGLLVNFENPETHETEFILVDGNHRVRIAGEADMKGLLYVINDPNDVKKALKFNKEVPHEFFQDDMV